MGDIELELRTQLMRARPQLSLSRAQSMIEGIASGCLEVRDDAIACGRREPGDFVTFCHVDGVALVAVFRTAAVEFFVFAADESFARDAEHFAMADVQGLMQLARSRYPVPEPLVIPASDALPWMEQSRDAEPKQAVP